MIRREALDEPIEAVLSAIKSFAEGAPDANTAGAARDNAEAVERLANAAHLLLDAGKALPSG